MWGAIVPALISLIGAFGGGSKDAPLDATQQRLLNATLGTQARRMTMQNPLYEAVQRLAMRLQPTAVQLPIPSFSSISPFSGEPDLGRAVPRGQATPKGGSGTATPKGGGGGTGGDAGGDQTDPGNDNEQPNPNLTIGDMGITPATLAQLFMKQY